MVFNRRNVALAGLAVLAVVVLVLGLVVGNLTRGGSGGAGATTGSGRLLVMLSVAVPSHPTGSLNAQVSGIRLRSDSGSWTTYGSSARELRLPGNFTAPNSDSLFLTSVPAQTYDRAQLELRSRSGSGAPSQPVDLKVNAGRLNELLFTVRLGTSSAGATQLTSMLAYAGGTQVNFGLQVAAGQVVKAPTVGLQNQSGQPVSLSQYRGKVVVLASFLTECQETCPLIAAALLQLHQELVQKGLSGSVQILEVTQDPKDDSPAILTKYRNYLSLPWPLLTGSTSNVNSFWSALKVPPAVDQPWGGTPAVDLLTGKPEPYNIVHESVLDVISPQGYVVAQVQGQPSLGSKPVPKSIYNYLDQQGLAEQRAGGSWNSLDVYQVVAGLLQARGNIKAFQRPGAAPVPGDRAPGFTLASTAGGSVSLSGLRGHPVMLDFWATWCTNCRADMKLVEQTASKYAPQGLKVELIDYQESRSAVTKFLRQNGINLPSLLDSQAKVAQRYGVPGLPVAVFISKAGTVKAIELGQLQQAQVQQDIPKILGP